MFAYEVVHSRAGELIYIGTQSVVLQTGLLLTKVEYPATPQQPVYITGRVEFFDAPASASQESHGDEAPVLQLLPMFFRRFCFYVLYRLPATGS